MRVESGLLVTPRFDPNLRSKAAGLELQYVRCRVERRLRGRTRGFRLRNVGLLEELEAFTLRVMIWTSLPSFPSPA